MKYPPIEKPTWSLDRLYFALKQQAKLPEQITVGGRVFNSALVTARYSLHVGGGGLQDAKDGDLVTIDVSLSDLTVRGTELLVTSADNLRSYVQSRADGPSKPYSGAVAEAWATFLATTRAFFKSAGLLEMTTPTLVQNPGMEPELEPFSTEWRRGREQCKLFLPTSPELHLKQLLAQGFHDIFEIKTVFRNEELTPLHEPEFHMIEWYRAFANLEEIISDLKGYLQHLLQTLPGELPDPRSVTVSRFRVADLFKRETGFDLTPTTSIDELRSWASQLKLSPSAELDWNDLFQLIWISRVEERLPLEPFLLTDYPPSQAALARLNSRGWADRVEFYWRRMEIANAFHELNDPAEQRRRFEHDQHKRQEYGRTPLEIDENFMRALDHGLPPSAGIALGLDRLFMAIYGIQQIQSTRPFAVGHQLRQK